MFVTKFLGLKFLGDPGLRDANGAPIERRVFGEDDDLEVATYYFQTLSNVLQYSTNTVLAALASELVVGADETRGKALIECKHPADCVQNLGTTGPV